MNNKFVVNTLKAITNPIHAIEVVIKKIKKPMRYCSGFIFDRKNKVATIGGVMNNLLCPVNKENLTHATEYEPIPICYLRLVSKNIKNDSPDFHFIDIGCGKGRACFYFASKYKKISGIDFSPKLIAIAERNRNTFKYKDSCLMNFNVNDARYFHLPEETSLIYLYNPFDADVLRDFLELNIAHFAKYNSQLVYVTDRHKEVLDSLGFNQYFRDSSVDISIYSFDS